MKWRPPSHCFGHFLQPEQTWSGGSAAASQSLVSTPGVLRGRSGGSLVPASGPLDCKVTVVLQLTPCADSILLVCFLLCGWRPCSALGDAVYSSSSPAPSIPHPQSLSTPFKIPQFPMLNLLVLIKAWMFPSSRNLTNHHGTPLLRLQNQASVSSSRMIDLLCRLTWIPLLLARGTQLLHSHSILDFPT